MFIPFEHKLRTHTFSFKIHFIKQFHAKENRSVLKQLMLSNVLKKKVDLKK